MKDEEFFMHAYDKIGKLAGSLIGESTSPEQAVAVAAYLTTAASEIFKAVGGPELAAAQFDALAKDYR